MLKPGSVLAFLICFAVNSVCVVDVSLLTLTLGLTFTSLFFSGKTRSQKTALTGTKQKSKKNTKSEEDTSIYQGGPDRIAPSLLLLIIVCTLPNLYLLAQILNQGQGRSSIWNTRFSINALGEGNFLSFLLAIALRSAK